MAKILLIDDEQRIRELLRKALNKRGYDVLEAGDGEEGLTVIAETRPDLIILDINMPGMGGLEFYRHISDAEGKPLYPVLVLTARLNLEELFKQLNVDGFMTKPFTFDDLFHEIDVIMYQRYGQGSAEKMLDRKPKHIMIVNDDEEKLDKITLVFLKAGYMVECASSGLEALDKIFADPPDVLLIKLGLPTLPGDVVITKLKKMPRTMNIVALLYSPYYGKLNDAVTKRTCNHAGLENLFETEDPAMLLQETETFLKQMEDPA